MNRLSFCLFLFLSPGLVLSSAAPAAPDSARRVTPLEAIHVAEIHTGGVVDSILLETAQEEPVYRIELHRGSDRLQSRVHAVHGRLLTMARQAPDGSWENTYQWPGIRVVAHRGGALLGPPENTMPAITKAIEIEADLIEVDIRQTKDGHLVLMHDVTVDRTTNGKGRVADLTLEQIRQLEIRHDGEGIIRVPTLREALLAMKGKIDSDLDFKEGDLEKLVAIVRETGMVEASTHHGSRERCRRLAQLEPRIRLRPTAEFPQEVPSLIRELRPAIVNLDWHAVTEEAVRLAHLGGCHAFVNCLGSADTEFHIRLAVRMGADYIQSDRPDWIIKILKESNLRPEPLPRGDPLGTPLRSPRLGYPLKP